MKKITLKNKLILLVSTLMIGCMTIGYIGYSSLNLTEKEYLKVTDMNYPDTVALFQAVDHINKASTAVLSLVYEEKQLTPAELTTVVKTQLDEYDKKIKAYQRVALEGDELKLFEVTTVSFQQLKLELLKISELYSKQTSINKDLKTTILAIPNLYKGFTSAMNGSIKWQQNDAKESTTSAKTTKNTKTTLIFICLIVSLLFGFFLSYSIIHTIMIDQEHLLSTLLKSARNSTMVEGSPKPTLMCDISGVVIFMNSAAKKELEKLKQFISIDLSKIVGSDIGVFHKIPERQIKLISDPKNLPYKSVISVGPEKMELQLVASLDEQGNHLGTVLTWDLITEKLKLLDDLKLAASSITTASETILSVSTELATSADEVSDKSNTASVAAEEVNAGVQSVSNNMDEMVLAIKEITKITNDAANLAKQTMTLATNANSSISKLGESSVDIGEVIKVISNIAHQTNLLALNASIEAARAGEHGKGFAVVANEVKELSKQTAQATQDISKKIETLQGDSSIAIEAIKQIGLAIDKMNSFTSNIASSVEEQSATTNEVARIVKESAIGVNQINENINQVSLVASHTGKESVKANKIAHEVKDIAETLTHHVNKFNE
jgi:methyl-accepting chemotaxis protein